MIKVMIVEDELSTRNLLKKLVNDVGYTDILANSAELAWDIWQVTPDIDLLITDVVLGKMTGLDLIRRIRRQPTAGNIPIFVCSGKVTKDEVIAYLDTGIQLFMKKPIDGEKMQQHIIKHVKSAAVQKRHAVG